MFSCSQLFAFLGLISLINLEIQGKLLTLISISRHGSRAPNPSAKRLCPKNLQNLNSYPVPLSQLTPNGMKEMETVGSKIRSVYVNELQFLASSINGHTPSNRSTFESYFRSDSADRCAQSAMAFGYGLYPDSTAPKGYHRQPIALTMNEWEHEYTFQIPHLACENVFKKDAIAYANQKGKLLFQQHHEVLNEIEKICGISLKKTSKDTVDMINNLKDIADMMEFDTMQNLPTLSNLKPNVKTEIQALAYEMLMERFYTTEQMITYWAGGMPKLLIQNIQHGVLGNIGRTAHFDRVAEFYLDRLTKQTQSLAVAKAKKVRQPYKYYSYHGHREMLYAMAMLLDWEFIFPNEPRSMDESSIPPATTMLFELHSENGQFHIETYVVAPQIDRTNVKLKKCSSNKCPLHEFLSIIDNHMKRTGSWEEICKTDETSRLSQNYNSEKQESMLEPLEHQMVKPTIATTGPILESLKNASSRLLPSALYFIQMAVGVCVGMVVGAFAMFNAMRYRRRQGYRVL